MNLNRIALAGTAALAALGLVAADAPAQIVPLISNTFEAGLDADGNPTVDGNTYGYTYTGDGTATNDGGSIGPFGVGGSNGGRVVADFSGVTGSGGFFGFGTGTGDLEPLTTLDVPDALSDYTLTFDAQVLGATRDATIQPEIQFQDASGTNLVTTTGGADAVTYDNSLGGFQRFVLTPSGFNNGSLAALQAGIADGTIVDPQRQLQRSRGGRTPPTAARSASTPATPSRSTTSCSTGPGSLVPRARQRRPAPASPVPACSPAAGGEPPPTPRSLRGCGHIPRPTAGVASGRRPPCLFTTADRVRPPRAGLHRRTAIGWLNAPRSRSRTRGKGFQPVPEPDPERAGSPCHGGAGRSRTAPNTTLAFASCHDLQVVPPRSGGRAT